MAKKDQHLKDPLFVRFVELLKKEINKLSDKGSSLIYLPLAEINQKIDTVQEEIKKMFIEIPELTGIKSHIRIFMRKQKGVLLPNKSLFEYEKDFLDTLGLKPKLDQAVDTLALSLITYREDLFWKTRRLVNRIEVKYESPTKKASQMDIPKGLISFNPKNGQFLKTSSKFQYSDFVDVNHKSKPVTNLKTDVIAGERIAPTVEIASVVAVNKFNLWLQTKIEGHYKCLIRCIKISKNAKHPLETKRPSHRHLQSTVHPTKKLIQPFTIIKMKGYKKATPSPYLKEANRLITDSPEKEDTSHEERNLTEEAKRKTLHKRTATAVVPFTFFSIPSTSEYKLRKNSVIIQEKPAQIARLTPKGNASQQFRFSNI